MRMVEDMRNEGDSGRWKGETSYVTNQGQQRLHTNPPHHYIVPRNPASTPSTPLHKVSSERGNARRSESQSVSLLESFGRGGLRFFKHGGDASHQHVRECHDNVVSNESGTYVAGR